MPISIGSKVWNSLANWAMRLFVGLIAIVSIAIRHFPIQKFLNTLFNTS